MMDAGHYLAEYDLAPPAGGVSPAIPAARSPTAPVIRLAGVDCSTSTDGSVYVTITLAFQRDVPDSIGAFGTTSSNAIILVSPFANVIRIASSSSDVDRPTARAA